MYPILQETVDLSTFAEKIINEKLHFLGNASTYSAIC